MPEFKLLRGGLQDRYLNLRTKIQVYGGGFGNGKTTAVVVKAISIGNDYPGANILMARSTYPKLNDTLRKEFIKWCPKNQVDSFPLSVNASNTCTWKAKNGGATTFNFRYIAQQGKSEESTTSNLLSATYDLVVVDQLEDPEITHKDFFDLFGRMRGQAMYRGDDPTMPRTGPRWMLVTVNPTRNWFYKKVVAPYHAYQKTGVIHDDLLCLREPDSDKPILDEFNKPILLVEIVEGGTRENQHNLPDDFISTMASTYRGQMRDRFLKGEWAAYEGLVYPAFNELQHLTSKGSALKLLRWMRENNFEIRWLEGYDYGIAQPACYLLAFLDFQGAVVIVDGFYKANYDLVEQANQIKRIRLEWNCTNSFIHADPSIFRRSGSRGDRISDVFFSEHGLSFIRADNDIINGITKVSTYLEPRVDIRNPFTQDTPAPMLYFCEELEFITTEIGSYNWKRKKDGTHEDEPVDGNDHAMDTIKYMFTNLPVASRAMPVTNFKAKMHMRWHEQDAEQNNRYYRNAL